VAEFDPGPVAEPFATLARDHPGAETYPPARFRLEWGPIFHRGRLDGTARVLVLGQDPGQHEAIARRILVGEAGQRVQGFLARVGIERSYCMLNAFLFSVYGQPTRAQLRPLRARIAEDRERWFAALFAAGPVDAVVTFGTLAREAWGAWAERPGVPVVALPHPTWPESASGGDEARRATTTRAMLGRWNAGLRTLDAALGERDADREPAPYGEALGPKDLAPIPAADLPAGSPPWMGSLEPWARRVGETAAAKRATIEVVVPAGERPWERG
jgi:uracil-DNA glycosylase